MRSLLGEAGALTPGDLSPIPVVLHIDEDGFLRLLDARGAAGTTTTVVSLDITRLDPPPAIVRPIP